ncbi:DMT family transporter [Paenibacillus sp. NPDC058071]|uniref:DMT family transporter n=1 Tax=Paenibacillus sp. NPDC058071 TaxID=3346326 RepID=UPI0036DBD16D
MKKGFLLLAFAIVFEVFGTTMLKLSDGFTNWLPVVGLVIGMGMAFYLMTLSLRYLALSLAYAIWSGVGTALTAIVGIAIWNEPFGFATGVGLLLIIGGVVCLNVSSGSQTEASSSKG